MTSSELSCLGRFVDQHMSCGCGRKSRMEEFEIINIEDFAPNPIFEFEFDTRPSASQIPGNLLIQGSTTVLKEYFERSLTNASSPKIGNIENGENAKKIVYATTTKSGPILSEKQSRKGLFSSWKKIKSNFRQSTVSASAIDSVQPDDLESQIEAYKNMWKYDHNKEYYYEDIKATGALLLDLPPEMLINLKYRDLPAESKSTEEVVKAFLNKLEGESTTSAKFQPLDPQKAVCV